MKKQIHDNVTFRWGLQAGKQIIFFLFLIVAFFPYSTKSEGTKELRPSASDSGYVSVDAGWSSFALYGCSVANRLHIKICNVGEKIYYGFRQANNDMEYRIRDPLGNIVAGPSAVPAAGAGFISTYAQAVAGPQQLVGASGYNALVYTPLMTGDYYIEFRNQGATRDFELFDITVGSAAGVPIKGRLWSMSWQFQTRSFTAPFKGTMYIYADDSVVTSVNFNGMQPFRFVVSANQTGTTNTGNPVVDRRSKQGLQNYPQYKIFLNDPDPGCFPTGKFGDFVQPTTITGCQGDTFCINVYVDKAGFVEILLNFNGVPGYQAGTEDIMLSANVVVGANCIQWNGRNGLGNLVSLGTQFSIDINYFNGLTHLPLYDVENHRNGYIVNLVRPAGPKPSLFWDDTNIPGGTTMLTPGCTSAGGCHTWGPWNGQNNAATNYGNQNTINTWWYANIITDTASRTHGYITTDANKLNPPGQPNDTTICAADSIVQLNGGVTTASGGKWSGGGGTFIPSDSLLSTKYKLTPSEIAIGKVRLILSSTGNGDCPPAVDTLIINVTPIPVANAGPDQKVCASSPSVVLAGSVANATGGQWIGGSGSFSPNNTTLNATYTPSAAEITSGSVTLKLITTGASICPGDTDQMVITISPLPTVTVTNTNVSCNSTPTGSATASVSGGTTPFVYTWSTTPFQTTTTATALGVGTYTITVTDGAGCSRTATTTITQPPVLTAAVTPRDVTCFGLSNGAATAAPSGGTSPYTYSWTTAPVQTGVTATGLPAGSYTVTVTDAKGCTVRASATVAQPDSVYGDLNNSHDVDCHKGNNGHANVVGRGGKAPYTYLWSSNPAQTTPGVSQLTAGTYTVTITDANGCSATKSVTLTEPAPFGGSIVKANVSCNGGSTASATVTGITGGVLPFNYTWSTLPVQNTATASNLSAGTYSVTVRDQNGCDTVLSVTITQPNPLVAGIASSSNVSCYGANNGTASVSVSGGTTPYTYSWNTAPVITTATATALSPGTYTVSVTDANNCTATVSRTITEPPVIATVLSSTNITCNGLSDGTATVSASGGSGSYTYAWSTSPVKTTATATGLSVGTFTVTVTDGTGCTKTATAVITQPATLTVSFTSSSYVNCFGGNDGTATATGTGGTMPYSYVWSTTPAQTTASATSLAAASYTVTVTDLNGCSKSLNIVMVQPNALAPVATSSNATCNGTANGSASVSVSGGVPTYSYTWNTTPVKTTASATGLPAGTYTVTVQDANSCTKTSSVTIAQPGTLTATASVSADVSCNSGNDGSASVSASGGTSPYSYSWNTSPAQTNVTATALTAGSYSVTVSDAQGCSLVRSVIINEPTALGATITSSTNLTCYLSGDGSAYVTASGGTSPYSYAWSTAPVKTTAAASGLNAGTYTVTVTDAKSCTKTATVVITQPNALLISIPSSTIVSCRGGSDGSATASVAGGTAPYSYTWNTSPVQTTETASNLKAGTYKITIVDGQGCSTSTNITIIQPSALVLLTSKVDANCGNNDGSATVTASGGISPYTYSWNTSPVQTTATATNLVAKVYTVTVTDNMACTKKITIPVNNLDVFFLSDAQTNVTCPGGADGSATGVATGGTPPYTFDWNTSPVQTTNTASNLAAGIYYLTATDANLCQRSLEITITEPDPIVGGLSTSNVTCKGLSTGSATVTANGGTGPSYSYTWSTSPVQTSATATALSAGTYTVTVADNLACDTVLTFDIYEPTLLTVSSSASPVACNGGTNGAASALASGGTLPYAYSWNTAPPTALSYAAGLSAGTYTVTVTDGNSCTITTTAEVTQPGLLDVSLVSQSNVTCNTLLDGSATATVTGGTLPYVYTWSTTPSQTTATAGSLSAGNYSLNVSDANGCPASLSITLTEPSVLTSSIPSATYVSCNAGSDGSATVTENGGTAPYTYSWNTSPVQTNATATGLSAGTYSVVVTDINLCTSSSSVTIAEPSVLTVTISPYNNITCFGGNNGAAAASVNGGSPSYSYSWNTSPVETAATATALSAGNYIVTVTDSKGCITSSNVTISEPSSLAAVASSPASVSCKNGADGSVTVAVSGATPAYDYVWNTVPTQTTAAATGLLAGTYTVYVTDANGCTNSSAATVTEPSQLTAGISSMVNVSCNGGASGSATATASGGTTTYTYAWNTSPVKTSVVATGLSAGTYTVTVTDAKGCTATASAILTEPAVLVSGVINYTNVLCFGESNGTATASASGGTSSYTYTWNTSPAQVSATATALSIGTYTVQVTDALGCTTTSSVTIYQPAVLTAAVDSTLPATCNGGADGSAFASGTGGLIPYSYSWNTSPAQITAIASGLSAGAYVVTVTDKNGCTATAGGTVTQPGAVTAVISAFTNVTCSSAGDGTATASGSGGVGGYTYSWSTVPEQKTQTATALVPGTYTVSVTDINGCAAAVAVSITQPDVLAASIASTGHVSCFGGNDGNASATISGGTSPYAYSWSTAPVQTTATATGLAMGTYTVTVTDANSCTSSVTALINQPNVLAGNVTTTSVSCNGQSDGIATVTGSGGTPAYSFQWNTVPVQTLSTASGLSAGNYVVSVTDSKGCTATISATVTEPALLSASISASSNVGCFGGNDGTMAASVTGGTTPYTYLWNSIPVKTTPTVSSLYAGTYTVNVTDNMGCTATVSATITQPTQLTTVIPSFANVLCTSGSTGSATASAAGGTPSYTYTWDTKPPQAAANATNLSAGIYTVTASDANGCTATERVTITEPPLLSALFDSLRNVSCAGSNNGAATISAIGGVQPYSFLWNTSPPQTATIINNLSAGIYQVVVTDANNCTNDIDFEIIEPDTLVANINSVSHVKCNGNSDGSATVSVYGGIQFQYVRYTYAWSTSPVQTDSVATGLSAGTYTVTVTDSVACALTRTVTITQPDTLISSIGTTTNVSCYGLSNGQASVVVAGGTPPFQYSWNTVPVQTLATAIQLVAKTYTVAVTDSNGCTHAASVTITQPPLLDASLAGATNVTCYGANDATATVSATGGTGPYTYTWNTVPVQNTDIITNNAPGTYTATVTDAKGCTDTAVVTLTEPSQLVANMAGFTNVTCYGLNNGTATVSATGGTIPYSYSWNTTPLQTTDTATGLSPGTYFVVTVTDLFGCSDTASVVVTEPPPLTASITDSVHITCNAGNDGSATVSAAGGTTPYTYQWSGTPSQTTTAATLLTAGTYSVVVTDKNLCSTTVPVLLTEPDAIVLSSAGATTLCIGQSATVSAGATGGSGTYVFLWDQGLGTGATHVVSPSVTTSYTVAIVDNKGCTAPSQTVVVTVNPPLTIVWAGNSDICLGDTTMITASASGGNGNYTYTWNYGLGNGPTHQVTPFNDTTRYVVTLSDNCGTPPVTDTFTVITHPVPKVNFYPESAESCPPLFVQFRDTSVTDPNSTYLWDFGGGLTSTEQHPSQTFTQPGTYDVTLTVTSPWGCSDSKTKPGSIIVDPVPDAAFDAAPTTVGNLMPIVQFTDYSTGATTWMWNFGDGSTASTLTSPRHDFPDVGTYTVTLVVTNQYGCVDTARLPINVKPDFAFYIPNAFTPGSDGYNDRFGGKGVGFTQYKMYVYDRWGNEIYYTDDYNRPWDGKANGGAEVAQEDVYVYIIYVTDFLGALHRYVGHVTLIK